MLRQALLFSMAAMLGSTINPAHSGQTNPSEPSKASKIYMEYCFSCHEFGVNGAPAPGDKEAWDTRLSQGREVLLRNTIFGMPPVMPPRGLCEACTDSDLDVVLDFMIHGAGGA